MIKNYRFKVTGVVQGVYYRKNVFENSIKENFSGYVKNLQDGSVEACVSCAEDKLEKFVNILKKGSQKSIVKQIERQQCEENFRGRFEIRY